MATLNEIDDIKARELIEIARSTEVKAPEFGCFKDDEGGIQNHFTVGDNETGKPIWTEWFEGVGEHHWREVLSTMIRIGIPISIISEGGYYIGELGEQGTIIAYCLNHIMTREETLEKYISSLWESGQFELAKRFITGEDARIKSELKNMEAVNVLFAFLESRNCFAEQTNTPRQVSMFEYEIRQLVSGN